GGDALMVQWDLAALPARNIDQRSTIRRIDPVLGVASVLLAVTGLLMVYSATNKTLTSLGEDPGFFLKRQFVYLLAGITIMAVVTILDYRLAKIYAPIIYLSCIGLLLLVQTPRVTAAKGAQRSFQFAGFQFSPSLFTRLGLIVMLAAVLSEMKGELDLSHVMRATAVAVLPVLLVFIQPDIGTTIILAAILVALLIASGARARYLAVLALAGSLAIFGAFQLHIIKDYQVQRITSFLDPQSDIQRAGYNRFQAEIATGSGGLFGKGYLHGTQTNLDYV